METGSCQRTQHSETDRNTFRNRPRDVHGDEMHVQARSWQSNHCKARHQSRAQVGCRPSCGRRRLEWELTGHCQQIGLVHADTSSERQREERVHALLPRVRCPTAGTVHVALYGNEAGESGLQVRHLRVGP